MNIIQARELALAGKTVICPMGGEYHAGDFSRSQWSWDNQLVFGEWREKREPRRVYALADKHGNFITSGVRDFKNLPVPSLGERIVEFVEVVSEKP